MKLSRVALFLLVLMVLTSGALAMPEQPALDSIRGVRAGNQRNAAASIEFELLNNSVALWSDGRGDVILEQRLRNTGATYITEFTWIFNWSPGVYSDIRAWDANGPLQYSTYRSGSEIYVTVYFRQPVLSGQNYQFSLAITIGNMVAGSGNDWQAHWTVMPGIPVGEYIQGVTFPSNATIQNVIPAPTTQRSNFLEWRYFNTPSDWIHEIDVTYTLSDTIAVPLFLQKNEVLPTPSAPWAGDPYGRYPVGDTYNTIGRWGCNMTSYAMIINYWAAYNQLSFRTSPRALNDWLRRNGGYDAGNGPVLAMVLKYANDVGKVPLYNPYPGYVGSSNDAVLDDYLRSGNPVIIGVGGHFVVATGKTTVNGNETFTINDPVFGQTTLHEKHNNQYYSIRLLSGTPADQRSLRISAHSPVELLVTDPQGRRSGYDPRTGQQWSEIPGAQYFVEAIAAEANPALGDWIESKILLISTPLDGQYRVAVHGTGSGQYEIDTYAADWLGGVTSQVERGQAQEGSIDEFGIEYSSDSGLPPDFHNLYLPAVVGN